MIKKIKRCKYLVQLGGNLSERVSRKQSSLNFSLFLFFFCFIEKFQSSINFEFSLRFFSAEFSVELSFSRIFFQLNFLSRTSIVDFHLFLFLGKLHSRVEWQNQSDGLSFHAFSLGLQIRIDSQIVVWQKGGSHFFYFSPPPFQQDQVPHRF